MARAFPLFVPALTFWSSDLIGALKRIPVSSSLPSLDVETSLFLIWPFFPLPVLTRLPEDNALAATAALQRRQIRISFVQSESSASSCLAISDNGVGMDAEQLRHWAVMNLTQADRAKTAGRALFAHLSLGAKADLLFLNSDLSFFGAGR